GEVVVAKAHVLDEAGAGLPEQGEVDDAAQGDAGARIDAGAAVGNGGRNELLDPVVVGVGDIDVARAVDGQPQDALHGAVEHGGLVAPAGDQVPQRIELADGADRVVVQVDEAVVVHRDAGDVGELALGDDAERVAVGIELKYPPAAGVDQAEHIGTAVAVDGEGDAVEILVGGARIAAPGGEVVAVAVELGDLAVLGHVEIART